jgi:cyclic nucleotide gated channel
MRMDHHLAIIFTWLLSLVNMFFTVHIATGFCTAYADPVSKVLGKNELVTDPNKIVKRYISANLFTDIVAELHVPQV